MIIRLEKHIHRNFALRKDIIAVVRIAVRNRGIDSSMIDFYINTALEYAGCGKFTTKITGDTIELRNLDLVPDWKVSYDDTPKPVTGEGA